MCFFVLMNTCVKSLMKYVPLNKLNKKQCFIFGKQYECVLFVNHTRLSSFLSGYTHERSVWLIIWCFFLFIPMYDIYHNDSSYMILHRSSTWGNELPIKQQHPVRNEVKRLYVLFRNIGIEIPSTYHQTK